MKWRIKDDYIEYNKKADSWTFCGELANKIMFALQKKERTLPNILKGKESDIRILTLNTCKSITRS